VAPIFCQVQSRPTSQIKVRYQGVLMWITDGYGLSLWDKVSLGSVRLSCC